MLTPKQHELLLFIHERLKETGIAPSFDEMKDALDLRSKSGIHRLISALEERKFIRRLPHRARALEILRLPESVIPNLSEAQTEKRPQTPMPQPARDNHSMAIGVMGRIAAGTPISAIQHENHRVSVPIEMMRGGEHYALEIEGDSMVDAGILNGDTAIIQKCDTAQNGEIIVALIEGEEATLKRLRRKGERIALEAANSHYETRIFGPDQVRVQGKLVGLLRKY